MKWVTLALGAAHFLDGAIAQSLDKHTFTDQQCYTTFSHTNPLKCVPTTVFTRRTAYNFTRQHTSTPIVIVTPVPFIITTHTSTTSTITVTASQSTDIAYTTVIATDTSFVSTTTSVTITIATTTSTINNVNTVTVEPPAGFTPISEVPSVENNGGGSAKKRIRRSPHRQALPQAGLSPRCASSLDTLFAIPGSPCGSQTPVSVTCNKFIDVVTYDIVSFTARPRTVTLRASTSTFTHTLSFVATSTVQIADATTTFTVTTNSVAVATSTYISTDTTTATATTTIDSVATYYPACAPINIIGHVGNRQISGGGSYNSAGLVGSGSTGVECCNSCMASPVCAGFLFSASEGFCYLIKNDAAGTCEPAVSGWSFNTGGVFPYVAGDGPCGQATYGTAF